MKNVDIEIKISRKTFNELLKNGYIDCTEKTFKSDYMHYGYTHTEYMYDGITIYRNDRDFGFGNIEPLEYKFKLPHDICQRFVLNAVEAGQKFNKYFLKYVFNVKGKLRT